MIGQLTAILAADGHNIANMLNKSKGEWAYSMFDMEKKAPTEETVKKINEKTKKERNSPLLFLGIYNKEEKISDAWFGTPAYCIETTVKTGRIFKINELCRKEKWVLFSLSLSGHGI